MASNGFSLIGVLLDLKQQAVRLTKGAIRNSLVQLFSIGPIFRYGNFVLTKLQVVAHGGDSNTAISKLCSKCTLVLDAADQLDGIYGPRYFGYRRNSKSREGLSGYEDCTPETSKSNLSAYIIWRLFDLQNVLEVGCSSGYLLEALNHLGYTAIGVDYSHYAVRHACPGAVGRISRGDLIEGLRFSDASFDLVVLLETLEHLAPEVIPKALAELRRLCDGFVYVTIPSFGPNDVGDDGWFVGKVKESRLSYYQDLGPSYEGPVPIGDLMLDAEGNPVEGHLTIASFTWWRRMFVSAGFVREIEAERILYPILAEFEMTPHWNAYCFSVPGTAHTVRIQIDETQDRRIRQLLRIDRVQPAGD